MRKGKIISSMTLKRIVQISKLLEIMLYSLDLKNNINIRELL